MEKGVHRSHHGGGREGTEVIMAKGVHRGHHSGGAR